MLLVSTKADLTKTAIQLKNLGKSFKQGFEKVKEK